MRDLRRAEKDAVILNKTSENANFFPKITQTIITTQRFKGRIICRSESLHYFYDKERRDRLRKASGGRFSTRVIQRRVKYIKEGGDRKAVSYQSSVISQN